jgi:hypothetical protein
MGSAAVRVGVGTRFQYDGEIVTIEEMTSATSGTGVLVKDGRGRRLHLELLTKRIKE